MTLDRRSPSRREDGSLAQPQPSPIGVRQDIASQNQSAYVVETLHLHPRLVRYLDNAEAASTKADFTTSADLVKAKAQLDAWEAKIPARPVGAPAVPMCRITESAPHVGAAPWKGAVSIVLAMCAGWWMARSSNGHTTR